MRNLYTLLLSTLLLMLPALQPRVCASVRKSVRKTTWHSPTTGRRLPCRISEPSQPATDVLGRQMTVVYLERLACEKIGRNSNATDVRWLLGQGYRVIELDYGRHPLAASPHINADIIAINDSLSTGTFCGSASISDSRAYVLFEGYRLQRDVSYYLDDPTVYNYPAAYSTMAGDSLYMDIAYPANPSRPVPVLLSFSYSNSYAGTAGEGYTGRYAHRRMYLGYTFAMFDDTILEGAPAAGMAWAIADHPKYCDWGRGNPPGGAQKAYGAVEVNPDAARKVRAAVRTLRHFSAAHAMSPSIAVYGFSRGSTAASLAIGDSPAEEWTATLHSRHAEGSSSVQAAVLGPGIFDYRRMTASRNEFRHIATYCSTTADSTAAWQQQGGACAIKEKAVPTMLFYNTDDDPEYAVQATHLAGLLKATGTPYQIMKDYGKGHSVPSQPRQLTEIYDFLRRQLQTAAH